MYLLMIWWSFSPPLLDLADPGARFLSKEEMVGSEQSELMLPSTVEAIHNVGYLVHEGLKLGVVWTQLCL